MATPIKLKKSSVANRVPLTTDLVYGELAVNYADAKLYFLNSSNAINYFISPGSIDTLTNKTLSNAIMAGTLTAAGSVGTAGQVLISTGTGVAWGAAVDVGSIFAFAAAYS
jgi:hypothetical protein